MNKESVSMTINESPEKQRVDAAYALGSPDRIPALGGWIADPAKICALADVSEDVYWNEPISISIAAYRRLGLDGILDVNVPSERGGYTLCTMRDMRERARRSLDGLFADADALAEPKEVFESFDFDGVYRRECDEVDRFQSMCGPNMYWTPARWEVVPNFEWYRVYGYENYMLAIAMDPERVCRLYNHSAAVAECNARVIARMVKEGVQPRAMLCGMDICGQYGPLIDPEFLRDRYFPLVRQAIQPLLDVGAKLIWHCDGDVRTILDDILSLGVGGLQGFQEECGILLEEIVERRTIHGEKLIVLGPVSVTKTLVQETPDGVRRAVREAIKTCLDKVSLVLFTSNEILPDVPLANLLAMYEPLLEG